METYKTYITIENPDRVVLSNLPFQVGQRVQIIVLPEYDRVKISQKLKALFTAICFQTRHKLKYKTRCGASPCDPSCGGFDRVLL
jgi:hypothetical protein